MQVRFEFKEDSELHPTEMAKMLIDIELLLLLGRSLTFLKTATIETKKFGLDKISYSKFISKPNIPLTYPTSSGFGRRALSDSANSFLNFTDVYITSIDYNSPPKIDVTFKVSIDVEKILKAIFEFIIKVSNLHQIRLQMHAKTALEKQKIISAELQNLKEIKEIAETLPKHLKNEILTALANRIIPMTGDGEYKRIDKIQIIEHEKVSSDIF